MANPIIQIFGRKNCKDTLKAIRFFKERSIKTQFVDLTEKGISTGELRSICKCVSLEELIDRNGKEFAKRYLQYMEYDIESELLNDALLFKTPITRCGQQAALGVQPETWKKWITSFKPE